MDELIAALRETATWADRQTVWNYDTIEVKAYEAISATLLTLAAELEG